MKQELGQTVNPDPEEQAFSDAVDRWVGNEMSFEEAVKYVPDHVYTRAEQRVVRRATRKVRQVASKIRQNLEKER